jgi:hypothetical protein
MKKPRKPERVSAEDIARRADRGEDVSRYFTNRGKIMPAEIQRVNVDFTREMLDELDAMVRALNISRQALIKTILRDALDRHYLAHQARKAS